MNFDAYHGVDGAQHQTNFNTLSAKGYRMISLSVYGDASSPLYAAVWVQRNGSAWVAVHGIDASTYQAFFNTWTAKSYVPVLVSATGPMANAVFAAVFEQGIRGPWQARHGVPAGPVNQAGSFDYLKTEAARVRAAEVLLDRGWGRPGQPLDIVSDTTLRITVEGNEHLQPRRERPTPPLPLDTPYETR